MLFDRLHIPLGLMPRVGFAAALVTIALVLSVETHLYATALIAIFISLLLLAGIVKSDAPSTGRALTQSASRADYLQTLLDTVDVALMTLDTSNRLVLANRNAQRRAGAAVQRLAQISWIGESAARQIEQTPPGQTKLVVCADGQSAFVSVSEFRAASFEPQRLIALQRPSGDLDAVELQASRDVMRLLAHEMMNSLTPIASLAETLNDKLRVQASSKTMPEETGPAIEAIARRSRGLLEFVRRYRQVSDVPQPRIEAIDALALMSRLKHLVGAVRSDLPVTFETQLGSLTQFSGDPVLIEQAVVNLLMNAFDAVKTVSEPKVVLELQVHASRLELCVIDNGLGVDARHRAQLFVPFFSTKNEGSGIGLTLARNIALAHGGRLSYEPNDPAGSRFTLVLPSG